MPMILWIEGAIVYYFVTICMGLYMLNDSMKEEHCHVCKKKKTLDQKDIVVAHESYGAAIPDGLKDYYCHDCWNKEKEK